MKISYEWLSDYVAHDLDPVDLGETLTMGGLEVDGLEHWGQSFESVVVGRVDAVRPHPNADRLVLCDVDVGGSAPHQIVCGAPNVRENLYVPVALPGATVQMPDREDPEKLHQMTVEETSLRGEDSAGMICSEVELSLSDDHSGVMVLDDESTVGQPFAEYLQERRMPATDTVYDIDLTPNRPDATSHIGVARDVAALTNGQFTRPSVEIPASSGDTANLVDITIDDPHACHRYVGIVLNDVTVGESPPWLQRRLKAIGLTPRNNVVDVTNYVMFECGQPLHAFDLNLLRGDEIHARCIDEAVPFVGLNGEEYELPAGALTIQDRDRVVAAAGILGGANTHVTEHTNSILLESAYFDPTTIRNTARALQLNTDSSYRFERGIDPQGQPWAATRAAALIAECTGATQVPGLIDRHPRATKPATARIRRKRIHELLGISPSKEQVVRYLEAIGCQVESSDDEDFLTCTIPTFRPDLTREIDLIEEVARLYGYAEISQPSHSAIPFKPPRIQSSHDFQQTVRHHLAGSGFREIVTNSMLPEERAERFNDEGVTGLPHADIVRTLNPISQEMAALRPTLVNGLLDVMAHNQSHGQKALRFFEIGRTYFEVDSNHQPVEGYVEHPRIIIGMSGPAERPGWDSEDRATDFHDLKGTVEALCERFQLDSVDTETYSEETAITEYGLVLRVDGERLGLLARVTDDLQEDYDLPQPVFFAELHTDILFRHSSAAETRVYEEIERYPRVDRDLAVVVETHQIAGALMETIRQTGRPLLDTIDVFDIYEGEHVAEGKKSIGFTLQFGADRTLVDEEVDEKVSEIIAQLEEQHNAQLRE